MGRFFDKTRFVFCNENEAKEIINEVKKTSDYYVGKGDFSFTCSEYDNINKGIIVSYSKRNDSFDDFQCLSDKYKTLIMEYDEEKYYTNDVNHEVFPKYIVDGKNFNSVDEIINRYSEKANWGDEVIDEMRNDFEVLKDYLSDEGVWIEEVFEK